MRSVCAAVVAVVAAQAQDTTAAPYENPTDVPESELAPPEPVPGRCPGFGGDSLCQQQSPGSYCKFYKFPQVCLGTDTPCGCGSCPYGDDYCKSSAGGASYCKFWLAAPVCQGSDQPCACKGRLRRLSDHPQDASGYSTTTAAPSGYYNPTTTAAPSEEYHSTTTATPSGYYNPATTAAPSDYYHPTTTAAPSKYYNPTTTAAPSDYYNPTTTAAPSDYYKPTTTAAPSDYYNPTTTAAPSDYYNPTTTATPSGYDTPSTPEPAPSTPYPSGDYGSGGKYGDDKKHGENKHGSHGGYNKDHHDRQCTYGDHFCKSQTGKHWSWCDRKHGEKWGHCTGNRDVKCSCKPLTFDCQRADAYCANKYHGSYCQYWKPEPTCHGTRHPCKCKPKGW